MHSSRTVIPSRSPDGDPVRAYCIGIRSDGRPEAFPVLAAHHSAKSTAMEKEERSSSMKCRWGSGDDDLPIMSVPEHGRCGDTRVG